MSARNKVLVLNTGSSSLKFKLFECLGLGQRSAGGRARAAAGGATAAVATASGNMQQQQQREQEPGPEPEVTLHPISAGLCERIGDPSGDAVMKVVAGSDRWREGERITGDMPDHGAALSLVARFLKDAFGQGFTREVAGVGHRVVHGASISEPVIVDNAVRATLKEACRLAPLHNPPNLYCIEAAQQLFPDSPHVAVFDTTFHQTMPPEAFTYPLPTDLCQQHKIRRYGFHGISYSYLTRQAAALLGKPVEAVNLIMCHLGAGSSMCAVRGGRCVDTSMGFTPLAGLMMGSRCGDIDPAILPHLMQHTGMSAAQVDTLMNKQSGFKGMTGSIDVREVEECAVQGDPACQLALSVYVWQIRKFLGAYMVHIGGPPDALVFSAGIGENGSMLRDHICAGLEWAGIRLDPAINEATVKGRSGEVQAEGSAVKVLVIPTDEQLEIAMETLQVVGRHQQGQPHTEAQGGDWQQAQLLFRHQDQQGPHKQHAGPAA